MLVNKTLNKLVGIEQSTYIEARSILDGPLIINELVTWSKKNKKKVFIFKIDFDKAFDSLNWGFLDSVLEQMGFSMKRRRWIKGCLKTGIASVLVNGSATKEFVIRRGVRQGDPLAPFIFILSMETLSIKMREACDHHLFKVITLPKSGNILSHLIYLDDVMFIGECFEMSY